MPVNFPAEPPGPVPLRRVSEFPGQGKTYPVINKAVFQHQQLRAAAANAPSPVKNRPNLVPSLQMLFPSKTKRGKFAYLTINRVFSRPKY
jgi:hypothetical protein